eukprot:COSAG06_NODE_6317_length_2987_cov_2.306440_3_plen_352_part_00
MPSQPACWFVLLLTFLASDTSVAWPGPKCSLSPAEAMRLGYDPLTSDALVPSPEKCDTGYRSAIFQTVAVKNYSGSSGASSTGCTLARDKFGCFGTRTDDIFEELNGPSGARVAAFLQSGLTPSQMSVAAGIYAPGFQALAQASTTPCRQTHANEFMNRFVSSASFVGFHISVGMDLQAGIPVPAAEFKAAVEALPEPLLSSSCPDDFGDWFSYDSCYLPNATNGDDSHYLDFFAKFGTHYTGSMGLGYSFNVLEIGQCDDLSGHSGCKVTNTTNLAASSCRETPSGEIQCKDILQCQTVDLGPSIGHVCKDWYLQASPSPISDYIQRCVCDSPPCDNPATLNVSSKLPNL